MMADRPSLNTAPAEALRVKINRVEAIPLRIPFGEAPKIASRADWTANEIVIVRLHTDAGVDGIGETQARRRNGVSDTLAGIKTAIDDHLAPRVLGRSPFDIAAIMQDLDDGLDRSMAAKATISDALYDLQGKILGLPVWALLGGRSRDTVEACAVLTLKDSVQATLNSARAYYDKGFRSFTLKVGLGVAEDVRNLRALREAFPDSVIRVDGNASMTFDQALRTLQKIEPFDIDAAEQPVSSSDLDGMAELARRVAIPIMLDEALITNADLITAIRRRAATVIQTKTGKNGGIWHSRKLWMIAAAAGMRIYPGNYPSSSIATAAVTHLCAAWPGELLDGPFAFGISSGALDRDTVREPLALDANRMKVPDRPGLGVEIDERLIASVRLDA